MQVIVFTTCWSTRESNMGPEKDPREEEGTGPSSNTWLPTLDLHKDLQKDLQEPSKEGPLVADGGCSSSSEPPGGAAAERAGSKDAHLPTKEKLRLHFCLQQR